MAISAAVIKDPVYRSKFVDIPIHIANWCADHGGLAGRDVLDFGCGEAITALGLATNYDVQRIVGVDTHDALNLAAPKAYEQLGLDKLPAKLELERLREDSDLSHLGTFDIIYSWSVFEHVSQDLIVPCFKKLKRILRPGGIMFLQTAPLYYSAEGSHLKNWIAMPWAHLLMQHNLLFDELKRAIDEPLLKELTFVYETLNRVTASQLLRCAQTAGFEIIREYRTFDEIAVPDELREIYTLDALTTNQLVFVAKHQA